MTLEIGQIGRGVITIDEIPVGISMGFYGCAEHEWGIKAIRDAFGVEHKGLSGLEAGLITKIPEKLQIGNKSNEKFMVYGTSVDKLFNETDRLYRKKENYVLTAWNKYSFGIRTNGKKPNSMIDLLESAFLENDVVIDESSLLVYRWGLVIYSKVPERIRQGIRKIEGLRIPPIKLMEITGDYKEKHKIKIY